MVELGIDGWLFGGGFCLLVCFGCGESVSVVGLASVGLFRLWVCFGGGGSVSVVVGLFHLWVWIVVGLFGWSGVWGGSGWLLFEYSVSVVGGALGCSMVAMGGWERYRKGDQLKRRERVRFYIIYCIVFFIFFLDVIYCIVDIILMT